MTAHLNLPWTWTECDDSEACLKTVHVDMEASYLNESPREWVECLIPECVITADWIRFFNDKGLKHNLDGPAVEHADGSLEWYVNGEPHRVDGPAVVRADGSQEWRLNGEYHRVDGPSRDYASGFKEWRQHGKLHREDGPALITLGGEMSYWLNQEQQPVPKKDLLRCWFHKIKAYLNLL